MTNALGGLPEFHYIPWVTLDISIAYRCEIFYLQKSTIRLLSYDNSYTMILLLIMMIIMMIIMVVMIMMMIMMMIIIIIILIASNSSVLIGCYSWIRLPSCRAQSVVGTMAMNDRNCKHFI